VARSIQKLIEELHGHFRLNFKAPYPRVTLRALMSWRNATFLFALLGVFAQPGQSQQRQVSVGSSHVCQEEAPSQFLSWARQNAISLKTLEPDSSFQELKRVKNMIGNARVVGIGEAARRVHEFYQIRHRFLEFLVEEMGFTAFAMETGFAEAIKLNDFVLGRIGEPKNWQQWFTFGYGDEEELQALVRWMRAYNNDPRHNRKIRFYGIDVMVPYSSPLTAIEESFTYLDKVDPTFVSSATRKDLLTLVQKFLGSGGSRQNMEVSVRKYLALPTEDRNAYTALISDLLARFESKRPEYIARSSNEAYQWSYHVAIAARQLDTTYRAAAAADRPGQPLDLPTAIWSVRDSAMLENVLWALDQEGASGRIMVWAHNAHISKGSVATTRNDVVGLWEKGPRLGLLLDLLLGSKYIAIGTSSSEGQSGWQQERAPAECGTLDRELARLNLPAFLLSFNTAPSDKPTNIWLKERRLMRADNTGSDYRLSPWQAWDAVLFIRHISPVRVVGP
jgi:erythromycin esterase